MAYHIAVDSCTDMTAAMKKDEHITLVPLTLNVGEDKFIDDETFNQAEFLRHVAECPEAPSSACPSPDAYMQAYGYDNEDAYAVTLSAELSGSYNSAKLGADLLKEEYPDKKIHVFNSRSASAGQTLILMKLVEQIGKTVIHPTEKYLMISHCNCLKRAEWLKVEIEKKYAFKGIVIVDTAGVATMYANDGGIVVAY